MACERCGYMKNNEKIDSLVEMEQELCDIWGIKVL